MMGCSGCGLGAGSQEGTAHLVVTQDHGNEILVDEALDDLTESENAIRVLDDNAEIETRYGGGFVQSVDGIEGGTPGGRSFDWFFSVNGVVSEVGGTEFPVNAGDQVWWDYRDWTDAMEVGAVVGAFPAPMSTGYKGTTWPVVVDCQSTRPACTRVQNELEGEGVKATITGGVAPVDGDLLRIVVGRWAEISSDDDVSRLDSKSSSSGVFARFATGSEGDRLLGLDVEGETARDFGSAAGLVAAMRRGDGPPVWVVTGGSDQGVAQAAFAFNRKDLDRHYAVVSFEGETEALPLP